MNKEQIASALYRDSFFLLVWDHKHGYDLSLHSTHARARREGARLMRETAEEWGEDVSLLSEDDLWNTWTEISGETEFFSIQNLTVNA
jgi:hypothetical protein